MSEGNANNKHDGRHAAFKHAAHNKYSPSSLYDTMQRYTHMCCVWCRTDIVDNCGVCLFHLACFFVVHRFSWVLHAGFSWVSTDFHGPPTGYHGFPPAPTAFHLFLILGRYCLTIICCSGVPASLCVCVCVCVCVCGG